MFKILDRYIIRKFLGTYIFAIILLLAIVVMFDINEALDSFVRHPEGNDFRLLPQLPAFASQFSPLFYIRAVTYSLHPNFARDSEIIAMLIDRHGFRRLLGPYLIGATVIAAATFCSALCCYGKCGIEACIMRHVRTN